MSDSRARSPRSRTRTRTRTRSRSRSHSRSRSRRQRRHSRESDRGRNDRSHRRRSRSSTRRSSASSTVPILKCALCKRQPSPYLGQLCGECWVYARGTCKRQGCTKRTWPHPTATSEKGMFFPSCMTCLRIMKGNIYYQRAITFRQQLAERIYGQDKISVQMWTDILQDGGDMAIAMNNEDFINSVNVISTPLQVAPSSVASNLSLPSISPKQDVVMEDDMMQSNIDFTDAIARQSKQQPTAVDAASAKDTFTVAMQSHLHPTTTDATSSTNSGTLGTTAAVVASEQSKPQMETMHATSVEMVTLSSNHHIGDTTAPSTHGVVPTNTAVASVQVDTPAALKPTIDLTPQEPDKPLSAPQTEQKQPPQKATHMQGVLYAVLYVRNGEEKAAQESGIQHVQTVAMGVTMEEGMRRWVTFLQQHTNDPTFNDACCRFLPIT